MQDVKVRWVMRDFVKDWIKRTKDKTAETYVYVWVYIYIYNMDLWNT